MGSVTEITDDSGQTTEKYEYDSFGNITIRDTSDEILDTSAVGNSYTYTSREYDAETGLYFYRARYYDASVGRFLTKDPLLEMRASSNKGCSSCSISIRGNGIDSFALQSNLNEHPYLYVSNNPINLNDPLGKEACILILTPTLLLPPAWVICAILGTVIIGGITYYKLSVQSRTRKDKWTCLAKGVARKEGPICDKNPEILYGTGFGPTQTIACNNAKAAVRASVPPGTQAGHVQCFNCIKR